MRVDRLQRRPDQDPALARLCQRLYHQDVWSNGRSETTGTYWYGGGTINRFWWSIPDGQGACTQIWYHKPGGGYEAKGLPCEDN